MWWKALAVPALAMVAADAAHAQFVIPGLTIEQEVTPAQQNRQVVPFKRALTYCIIRRALADSAAPLAYRDGTFDAYVVRLIDECPDERRNLIVAYNQVYGQGQAGPFINGPYAEDLPRAVLQRIKPKLETKVAELKRTEAQQAEEEKEREVAKKAEADARERQAAAERARQEAETEKQAEIAKADADRAKAAAIAASQAAEAERLKQVEIATGAAKVLAMKTLDCGKEQLRSLVKSGESAEVLASAVMTICGSDVDHFVDAGVKEYHLEHQVPDVDAADGILRERLKSDTRQHIVALAVQAKAGVGTFAATSN